MAPSPYDVLGVSSDVTDDELREAYRTAARKLHPDRHQGDKRAEEAMRHVNEAWSLVGSPERRRAYDGRHDHASRDAPSTDAWTEPWVEKQPVSRVRHVGVFSMVAILVLISVFSAYARITPNLPARVSMSSADVMCATTGQVSNGQVNNGQVSNGQVINGTAGNDVLVGTEGDDLICGGDGNDRIDGRGGNDTIMGGRGDDVLIGGTGNDDITGGPGDNTMTGGVGDDRLIGDVGTDTGDGAEGLNRCYGVENVNSCDEPGPWDPPATGGAYGAALTN
jgi:DnaJ domain/RTX calcium-binding nonapeptide repeat (4 copies)